MFSWIFKNLEFVQIAVRDIFSILLRYGTISYPIIIIFLPLSFHLFALKHNLFWNNRRCYHTSKLSVLRWNSCRTTILFNEEQEESKGKRTNSPGGESQFRTQYWYKQTYRKQYADVRNKLRTRFQFVLSSVLVAIRGIRGKSSAAASIASCH